MGEGGAATAITELTHVLSSLTISTILRVVRRKSSKGAHFGNTTVFFISTGKKISKNLRTQTKETKKCDQTHEQTHKESKSIYSRSESLLIKSRQKRRPFKRPPPCNRIISRLSDNSSSPCGGTAALEELTLLLRKSHTPETLRQIITIKVLSGLNLQARARARPAAVRKRAVLGSHLPVLGEARREAMVGRLRVRAGRVINGSCEEQG